VQTPSPEATSATPGEAVRNLKTEGTGFEPATPFGASDFESGIEAREARAASESASGVHTDVHTGSLDADLAAVVAAWPSLPAELRARILAMLSPEGL
jgi:hypothetical protein